MKILYNEPCLKSVAFWELSLQCFTGTIRLPIFMQHTVITRSLSQSKPVSYQVSFPTEHFDMCWNGSIFTEQSFSRIGNLPANEKL